jgi:hypothetical protein
MSRNFKFLLGFALIAVTVGLGLASIAGATTAKKDQVNGTGVRQPSDVGRPPVSFSIDTWSSPAGANPTGKITVNTGIASWTGHPVCLNVNGNMGTIVGIMDKASGSDTAVGGAFLIEVWDNGKTVNGVSPDQMSFVVWGTSVEDAFGTGATVADVCANPGQITGDIPFGLLSGNINVVDAS